MSLRDLLALLGVAAGASLVAASLGGLLLHRLRSRSVRIRAGAIAASACASTVVGVLVAANAMFISSHDLGALFVVITVSASVGIGAALQLGRGLDTETQLLRDLTRRLGSAEGDQTSHPSPTAPEFIALAEEVSDLPRRLTALRDRADALERSRRDLVAWVSHDLRSPLATIRAMAEALDDGVVSDAETQARYHQQIRRDAERLSALVDDLFELSRITSGVVGAQRDRVSIYSLVEDALSAQQRRAESRGVRLIDEVDDRVAVVEVAVPELTRVLHNLLDNAIRHTPAGGTVVVRLSAMEGLAALSVQDQCGGIPRGDLDRVFDVAFRGDTARSRGQQGGGLGLAIAKGLVEASAGAIVVDNFDNGCRFTVKLPLCS